MKRTAKTIMVLCMVASLFFSVSISANADIVETEEIIPRGDITPLWCPPTSVTVPGLNGSATTFMSVPKGTDSEAGSIVCLGKSNDRKFDARIVNTLGESRSSWARDLPIGSVINVTLNGAVKGYNYQCQVSSDLLSYGETTVTLSFSPDFFKNYP